MYKGAKKSSQIYQKAFKKQAKQKKKKRKRAIPITCIQYVQLGSETFSSQPSWKILKLDHFGEKSIETEHVSQYLLFTRFYEFSWIWNYTIIALNMLIKLIYIVFKFFFIPSEIFPLGTNTDACIFRLYVRISQQTQYLISHPWELIFRQRSLYMSSPLVPVFFVVLLVIDCHELTSTLQVLLCILPRISKIPSKRTWPAVKEIFNVCTNDRLINV